MCKASKLYQLGYRNYIEHKDIVQSRTMDGTKEWHPGYLYYNRIMLQFYTVLFGIGKLKLFYQLVYQKTKIASSA
jgi:hypothetical protein